MYSCMSTVSTLPRPTSLHNACAAGFSKSTVPITTLEPFMVHGGASIESHPYRGSAHDKPERPVGPRNGSRKPVGSNIPQVEVFP